IMLKRLLMPCSRLLDGFHYLWPLNKTAATMAAYPFYKYQGAGDDFILFDNRTGFFDRGNKALVSQLCDRRFGIGGDGLMLLQQVDGYDFEMVYYNADGREGSMCGNGGRC